jgi:hypothetical protein
MGDYLRDCGTRRAKSLFDAGVSPGDFVNVMGKYGDVWYEVEKTFFEDKDPYSLSLTLYDTSYRTGTNYTYLHNCYRVHHRNDPWDDREVMTAFTKDGEFSDWGSERHPRPRLPDELRYHGTYTIVAWWWGYHNRPGGGRTDKDLKEWAKAAGDLPLANVPWNEAPAIMKKLAETRIKGWRPSCKGVPEQVFKKSILAAD